MYLASTHLRPNISSTKSMTGHCLGAAGVVEAIACIMSVVNDIVPPTINHFTDDPELDPRLNFTFLKPQKRKVQGRPEQYLWLRRP